MIDPKELRLENLLWLPGINRFVKVSAIFKTHFRCQDFDGISFDESIRVNYQPVELTPDILEAAGCKKDVIDGWNLWVNGNLFVIRKLVSSNGYTISVGDYCLCDMEYLHTFQNAYNLLTGQELQIDLQKLNKQP